MADGGQSCSYCMQYNAICIASGDDFYHICMAFSLLTGNALQQAAMSDLSSETLIIMSAITEQRMAIALQAAKAICNELSE